MLVFALRSDDGYRQGLQVRQQSGCAPAQGVPARPHEVEIYRRGDEIVLRERPRDLVAAFELLCALPDDVLADRGDDAPQTREGL